jgi:hypothetical protein
VDFTKENEGASQKSCRDAVAFENVKSNLNLAWLGRV